MALGIGGRQGRRLRSSGPDGDSLGRDFRNYLYAQVASQTGTQMASLAISFAVLAAGGGGSGLGLVMGARILPRTALVAALPAVRGADVAPADGCTL
ncbi:hypothetical protein [Streptacidiphilus sp. MAP5-3]|uniref:hypothetical protein n=1 Tax=unclassified Streptacidiphilus TaxID=2643834 RepID=UPI003519BDA0